MNNIFMYLLMALKAHGEIIAAVLKDESYSSVTLVSDNEEYIVTVIKKKVEEEKNV